MSYSRTLPYFLAALLSGSAVQAEPIPFNYTVSNPTVYNNNNSLKTSSFVFGGGGSGSGTATDPQIVAFGTSSATITNPDSFVNVPISLSVALVDDASQGVAGAIKTGTATFNGSLSIDLIDPLSGHADDWHLTWAESQEKVTLGSPGQYHTYTVIAPFVVPYPFSGDAVQLNIQATDYTQGSDPLPGQTAVTSTPEPTSLMLALLALPAFTLARRYPTRRPGDPRSEA